MREEVVRNSATSPCGSFNMGRESGAVAARARRGPWKETSPSNIPITIRDLLLS